MKKYFIACAFLLIALFVVSALSTNAAITPGDLSGWAWSSNAGWLSFNGSDDGAGGGSYKVSIDNSGNLSGYAWSSNIGWVKFGGLSSFPTNDPNAIANNAQVDTSTGEVTGWVRACAGTLTGDCTTMNPRIDGWDGWISLSGTNHSSPGSGITLDTETGDFSGYAWGGDVIGWLSFASSADTYKVCVGDDCGSGSGSDLSFVASSGVQNGNSINVTTGSVVDFNWSITNLDNCSKSSETSWSSIDSNDDISGNHSGTDSSFGSYTFSTTGSYNYQITCEIPDSDPVGTINKSVTVTVSPYVPPTLSCVLPSKSTTCPDVGLATFDYDYSNAPSGTPVTTVGTSCPVPSTATTYYCTYVCESGYKPNSDGTKCTSATLEEE